MLNAVCRTVILFAVTAVVLRLMGKRQLAQLQPYEVVITLMISDLATLPMSDVEAPLLGGVVSILTLLVLHSLLSAASFASMRMRRLICGRPSVLVRNGKICEKELERLCFDLSDLMESMRAGGVQGLSEAGSVILETNGALSVFPSAGNRPPTRREQGLPERYDGIPLMFILDGRLQRRSLELAGVEEETFLRFLGEKGIERVKEGLAAALDTQGMMLIQEKGDGGRLLRFAYLAPERVRW